MKLTPLQILLLVLAVLFSSFCLFYLGARFGPDMFWGIDLAEMQSTSLLPKEAADEELKALLNEEFPEIHFQTVLEGKSIKEEVTGALPKEEVLAREVKKDEPKKEEKIVALIKEEPKKPEVKQEPKKEVLAPAAGTLEGLFALQVGSFQDLNQAEIVRNQYQSRGYSATIRHFEISDKGTWHRVYVGSYPNRAAADSARADMVAKYKGAPLVVEAH